MDENTTITRPKISSQPPTIPTGGATDVILQNAPSYIDYSANDPDSAYHYFVASPMYAGFGDLNSPERISFLDDYFRMSFPLKKYLSSADTADFLFSLRDKYNLDDSFMSEISIQIRKLLCGEIFIKEFPSVIASTLSLDNIKANNLTNEIISQSFGPIIEDVKRIQRNKFPDKITNLRKEGQPAGLTRPEALGQTQPLTQSGLAQPQPSLEVPSLEVKPQFKMPPDLDGTTPFTNPKDKAQESLEEELKKVASVIDLRNKPDK